MNICFILSRFLFSIIGYVACSLTITKYAFKVKLKGISDKNEFYDFIA